MSTFETSDTTEATTLVYHGFTIDKVEKLNNSPRYRYIFLESDEEISPFSQEYRFGRSMVDPKRWDGIRKELIHEVKKLSRVVYD